MREPRAERRRHGMWRFGEGWGERGGPFRFQPRRGAGIEPGVSTPGKRISQIVKSPEGAQAAGSGQTLPAPLRGFWNGGGRIPGVETPGSMPTPLRGSLMADQGNSDGISESETFGPRETAPRLPGC